MTGELELINDAIEELTTTGKQEELDVEEMRKLKNLCKKSTSNLKLAYEVLMGQLEKGHAEIRYSAFQVINQLFWRSHLFRELIVFNLHNIFLLTIESDSKSRPILAPSHVSKKLKKHALLEYNKWFHRYSKGYPKLQLGFEFLRDVKRIKFKDLEVQTLAEQERIARQKEKDKQLNKNKLDQVEMQFYDRRDNMKSNIKQMERCFEIVVPKATTNEANFNKVELDHANSPTTIEKHSEDFVMTGNEAGLGTSNFSVAVEIRKRKKIQETADNTDVLKQLMGLYKEANKQSTTVKQWLNILVKCGSQNSERIKQVLKLKNKLTAVCNKYMELDVQKYESEDDEDSDDDQFVDVPEKVDGNAAEYNSITNKQENVAESSSSTGMKFAPTDSSAPFSASNSSRETHLKIAPVVPFDTDLKCWGADKISVASSVKYDSLHRFWKTSEHEETFVPPQVEASMRERRIVYESKFEPVTRMCGALLPSGRPCERMDRYKCPFHGPIVERDLYGTPVKPSDAERELKRKREREQEDRVSIQKDIDAMLGTSLSKKKKKKKNNWKRNMTAKEKSKERYARLTKINDSSDTPSSRLRKKVFSSHSLEKVYSSINSQVQKKHEAKFGSNFNYF